MNPIMKTQSLDTWLNYSVVQIWKNLLAASGQYRSLSYVVGQGGGEIFSLQLHC